MNKTDKELAVELAIAYLGHWEKSPATDVVKPEVLAGLVRSLYDTIKALD